ncbi:Zinc finger protein [Aspergillus sp. HF37]|nr:Zinc finger protein [Aspergillus sp. HF37]
MSFRRHQNLSDESQASSSLCSDVKLTNQLSAQLDSNFNEFVESQLPQDLSAAEILMEVLSPHSTTSMASSFGNFHQSQHASTTGYRVIGFGQCGLVFERPGRGYVVKAAKPAYELALWNDFRAHFNVGQAFQKEGLSIECRVPRIFSYVRKDNREWWDENRPLFSDVHESLPLPAMVLVTERILPLPKVARQALVNTYCPPALRPTVSASPANRDCLARLYLGRRRRANAPLSPNFSLRNFNMFVDQIFDLNLPANLFASAMGEALAVIHWSANVDAYDVEFVLGSEGDIMYNRDVSIALNLTAEKVAAMAPHTDLDNMMSVNFRQRTTRLWVLDFNLCNVWEEKVGWESPDALISHLVMAFFENDPYYPLPLTELDEDRQLWETFCASYVDKGTQILSAPGKDRRLIHLPRKFIEACVNREKQNLDQGLGHGHREFKE